MRPPRVLVPLAILLVACVGDARDAAAQTTSLAYDVGVLGATVRTLGPLQSAFGAMRARAEDLGWGVGAIASASTAVSGGPAFFLQASADVGPVLDARWRTEVEAFIGGAIGFDGTSRGVMLRQRAPLGPLALWAGGGIGDTPRAVTTSLNTVVEGGAAWPIGPVVLRGELRQWRTADWPLVEAAGHVLVRPAKAYDLREVGGGLQWRAGPLLLALGGTYRRGAQATTGSDVGVTASAEVALQPGLALLVHGGRVLADPMHGTPTWSGALIGLRMRPDASRPVPPASPALAEALLVRDSAGAPLLALEAHAPADARVEVSASFLDWQPRAMTREGTRWVARLPLPSGTHRVAVRVNGGAWAAPAGLPRVDDELGGASGILVVP